jgi:hypothetical protein
MVTVWVLDAGVKIIREAYIEEVPDVHEQGLISALLPGWQLPLNDLFDFRGRF